MKRYTAYTGDPLVGTVYTNRVEAIKRCKEYLSLLGENNPRVCQITERLTRVRSRGMGVECTVQEEGE